MQQRRTPVKSSNCWDAWENNRYEDKSNKRRSPVRFPSIIFCSQAPPALTGKMCRLLFFLTAAHFYCSASVKHRTTVDVSGVQVFKVKVQPGAHFTAPEQIHVCLKKLCCENLFLQIVFGATVAWGSFKPMKAADWPVAGSRTTFQNSLGAGT